MPEVCLAETCELAHDSPGGTGVEQSEGLDFCAIRGCCRDCRIGPTDGSCGLIHTESVDKVSSATLFQHTCDHVASL